MGRIIIDPRNPEAAAPDRDIAAAMEEIRLILENHDLAGVVMLAAPVSECGPKSAAMLLVLETEWSGLEVDRDGEIQLSEALKGPSGSDTTAMLLGFQEMARTAWEGCADTALRIIKLRNVCINVNVVKPNGKQLNAPEAGQTGTEPEAGG